MTEVQPAADATPARWLLDDEVDWWELVRYGPSGFEVYLRVALEHVPQGVDPEGEQVSLRVVIETLAAHTTTPEAGYAAVWEGWSSGSGAPTAPQVEIPHRTMLLFTGPVRVLRDAPTLAWYGDATGGFQEPHLVWPADQAWCVACEVDEEIEFSVGCSVEAAYAVSSVLPGAVRRVQYGENAPMYRDRT